MSYYKVEISEDNVTFSSTAADDEARAFMEQLILVASKVWQLSRKPVEMTLTDSTVNHSDSVNSLLEQEAPMCTSEDIDAMIPHTYYVVKDSVGNVLISVYTYTDTKLYLVFDFATEPDESFFSLIGMLEESGCVLVENFDVQINPYYYLLKVSPALSIKAVLAGLRNDLNDAGYNVILATSAWLYV